MRLQLIPVIEITNYDQDVPLPASGPYWEHLNEWENYNQQAASKAGFTAQLKPYSKATSFYRVSELSDEDILKSIEREIKRQQTDEMKGGEDLVCAYGGGFVLRIDEEDIYFPQCCGGLDDIEYWEQLIKGQTANFFAGHPYPLVIEQQGKICFDFANAPLRESFVPPIAYPAVEVEITALECAIQEAKRELELFAKRLHTINQQHNLQITEIDKRLIWGYDD